MSKRYGRNKKRKHIEQINKISELNVELQRLLRENKEYLREIINSIESVCKYSSLLKLKSFYDDYERDRFIIEKKQAFNTQIVKDNMQYISFGDIEHINLYALKTFIRENEDILTTSVHMQYCSNNEKNSTYMISKNALKAMSEKQIAKYFVPKITEELIFHLKK